MALQIKKAVKYDSKLRMSIAGPSGSGKTYTALTLAHALADGKPVCVIDTERGSASKYADDFPEYDVIELDTFSPALYVEAIKMVEEAGYGVLVIDSLSHAWNGTGGLLEIVENIAQRKYNKNTYVAWKDATPLQNALIDAITRANLHIIATMRSKQEYILEKNERTGKMEPRKAGMAPIQRDGLEYEFDVAVDMDIDNTMIVQKSRCSTLAGQVISKPGPAIAETLKMWLQGAPAPAPRTLLTVKGVYDACVTAGVCTSKPSFYAYASSVIGANISQDNVMHLSQSQLQELLNASREDKAS